MAMKTNAPKLTLRQERFAQEYVANGSGVEAYRMAYDTSPDASPNGLYVAASRSLNHPKIALRIQELQAEAVAASGVTATHTLDRLKRYMDDEGGRVRTAAVRATELAMRYHGMITDRQVIRGESVVTISLSMGPRDLRPQLEPGASPALRLEAPGAP